MTDDPEASPSFLPSLPTNPLPDLTVVSPPYLLVLPTVRRKPYAH